MLKISFIKKFCGPLIYLFDKSQSLGQGIGLILILKKLFSFF